MTLFHRLFLLSLSLLVAWSCAPRSFAEVAEAPENGTGPSVAAISTALDLWMSGDASPNLPPDVRERILASWREVETKPAGGTRLFEKLIADMRVVSPAVAQYLDSCDLLAWQKLPFGQTVQVPVLPERLVVQKVQDSGNEAESAAEISADFGYLTAALEYYLALRLVQGRFFEEAEKILAKQSAFCAIDPASVLLHRAVVHFHLMNFEKSVADLESFQKTVKKMAESDLTTPRRYHELAKLLEALLEQTQKEQAAQRIARKMSDIRRRLGQGRTDQDTQNAEGDVLESLDQLLEKLEAQQGQKPQEGQQSNNPAQDSGILKQSAPGQVDRRSFDVGGEWGDMPPKEREEAMQRIEQDFPAQYRDIVEQYFREMAGQSE